MNAPEDLVAGVERVVGAGGDADDVLRNVVDLLHERFEYVAIAFREGDEWVVGPSAGAEPAAAEILPIEYGGAEIAELRIAPSPPPETREALRQVAPLLGEHCLVGWDTQGETWDA